MHPADRRGRKGVESNCDERNTLDTSQPFPFPRGYQSFLHPFQAESNARTQPFQRENGTESLSRAKGQESCGDWRRLHPSVANPLHRRICIWMGPKIDRSCNKPRTTVKTMIPMTCAASLNSRPIWSKKPIPMPDLISSADKPPCHGRVHPSFRPVMMLGRAAGRMTLADKA